MTEAISIIITLIVTVVLQMLKPEWFLGWLVTFLNKKLPGKSNKIENSLGQKLVETGVYIIKYNPDNEKIANAVKVIEEQNTILKDELKNF